MTPTAFDEDNCVLHPPEGVSPDDVEVLSVYRGVNSDGVPVVISCWKPSDEELNEILRTGRVWLVIAGYTMPPASVLGVNPIMKT